MQFLIALGSNLGDRLTHLREATRALTEHGAVLASSTVWETDAMYLEEQPPFLNAVVRVDADLEPLALLDVLLATELRLGRIRTLRNGPRTIDLDLLAAGATRLEHPRLVLPHPRLHERPFVLYPLCEIDPAWRHPLLGRTAREMCDALPRGEHPPRSRDVTLPVTP